MTLRHPHRIDRRALLARSAAAAAFAGALRDGTFSAAAQTPVGQDGFAGLVAANTTFALDLYRELRASADGNLLFSPYSISLALAMTYAGARGETAMQMADTLALDPQDAAIHETLGALTADLVARGNAGGDDDDGGERGLRIANALWGEQSFPFDPAFTGLLETHYDAGLELTDFVDAPDDAREEINDWVAEQTEDRIKDIVPPGAISALTRLVLANAIYFYGVWRSTFDEVNTEDDAFHLIDGTTVDVPFMRQTASFPYAGVEGAQLVELPYEAAGFRMTIILPDEGEFEAFEDGLAQDSLQGMLDSLESTRLRLRLPRFEFDFAASLGDTLRSLGMTDAFDPDRADFSGMIEGDPDEELVISEVLHKAFISVDEEGTEAAAATVVIMETTSAAPEPQEPIELWIDRPFLFAIRDAETGTILFLGRVLDPR